MPEHSSDPTLLNRRAALRAGFFGGAAVLTFRGGLAGGSPVATVVADTTVGKVRGASARGVMRFLGIPYGGDTGGANRFMAPTKRVAWQGVRDATAFSGMSPQVAPNFEASPIRDYMNQLAYSAPTERTEDCLTLNVWTRGLRDGKKRPVMVWFHGGGFESLSANTPLYDGTASALNGDVVMVTVNHRLNVLGYLWLGDVGGEKYARAANPGMLDLVASLEWVRDNIANFGGDPGNVTIFGESGGGGKVSTLLAMPSAKGLFHKAIIESSRAILKMIPRDSANSYTEAYLKVLGVSKDQIEDLHSMPYERLAAAMAPAAAAFGVTSARPALWPVVDGHVLPRHPFDPTATDISDDVPVLVGSNKDEFTLFSAPILAIWNRTLTDAQLQEQIAASIGQGADRVIATYKQLYPSRSPAELLNTIETARGHWLSGVTMAERKQAKGKARVYMYQFNYESHVADNRLGTPHGAELPFVFDTVDVSDKMAGRSPEAFALARKCNEAWTTFARTGVPAARALPAWPAYEPANRATMVLDVDCHVVNDPHKVERELWQSLALPS